VVAPLAVAVGETVPQGAVAQETVQLTPAFAGSLLTVAASCVVAPGSIVPRSAGVLTVIGTWGVPPSPPHAARVAAASSDRRNAALR
jgi:hypothetical protein